MLHSVHCVVNLETVHHEHFLRFCEKVCASQLVPYGISHVKMMLRMMKTDFNVCGVNLLHPFYHFWIRSPCILQQPQSVFEGAHF